MIWNSIPGNQIFLRPTIEGSKTLSLSLFSNRNKNHNGNLFLWAAPLVKFDWMRLSKLNLTLKKPSNQNEDSLQNYVLADLQSIILNLFWPVANRLSTSSTEKGEQRGLGKGMGGKRAG